MIIEHTLSPSKPGLISRDQLGGSRRIGWMVSWIRAGAPNERSPEDQIMNPHIIPRAACAALATLVPQMTNCLQLRPLFPFDDASSIESWSPTHDRVMGGVSTGRPVWTGECARFSGELSLENNGGFASFRVQLKEPLDLSDQDGLRLRVRGDGRNWKVSLRTGQDLAGRGRNDHNWQAPFQTRKDADWQDVKIPFSAFVPGFHGRYARTEDPLDTANIVNLGLQVADGQAGEYSLDVASIEAWTARADCREPGTVGAHQHRSEILGKALDESPTAETLATALQWSERVLVVAEPLAGNNYGKSASIQRGRLIAAFDQLVARELRIVHVLGERAAVAAGRQLDPQAARALRDRWDLPADQWSCALVGKDGGVKKRWDGPFDPVEAFDAIDAMPMRRSEESERSGSPDSGR